MSVRDGLGLHQNAVARVAFFLFLAIVLVVPVWSVKYPPLLDYANHFASGFVLAHLHDPGFHFSDFYREQWDAYPYMYMRPFL